MGCTRSSPVKIPHFNLCRQNPQCSRPARHACAHDEGAANSPNQAMPRTPAAAAGVRKGDVSLHVLTAMTSIHRLMGQITFIQRTHRSTFFARLLRTLSERFWCRISSRSWQLAVLLLGCPSSVRGCMERHIVRAAAQRMFRVTFPRDRCQRFLQCLWQEVLELIADG